VDQEKNHFMLTLYQHKCSTIFFEPPNGAAFLPNISAKFTDCLTYAFKTKTKLYSSKKLFKLGDEPDGLNKRVGFDM
jgi:hypothetical protein